MKQGQRQSLTRSLNQSINQSINKSINQLIRQSVSQTIDTESIANRRHIIHWMCDTSASDSFYDFGAI